MDLLREINEKYILLETEVNKRLEKVKCDEDKLSKLLARHEAEQQRLGSGSVDAPKDLSYAEATQRNANLLKSLEMAKARLRSRTTYSPVEQILQKALDNYERELDAGGRALSARSSQINNNHHP